MARPHGVFVAENPGPPTGHRALQAGLAPFRLPCKGYFEEILPPKHQDNCGIFPLGNITRLGRQLARKLLAKGMDFGLRLQYPV